MTDDLIKLARRAVACKGWRWMQGMRARGCGDSGIVTNVWSDADTHQTTNIFVSYDEECRSCEHVAPDFDQCLPDLSDPATLGCLLALVREAWGSTAHIVRLHTNVFKDNGTEPACWWALAVGLTSEPTLFEKEPERSGWYAGPTEAEALVAALEGAP